MVCNEVPEYRQALDATDVAPLIEHLQSMNRVTDGAVWERITSMETLLRALNINVVAPSWILDSVVNFSLRPF
jgi:hypothetical protein